MRFDPVYEIYAGKHNQHKTDNDEDPNDPNG